MRARSSLAKASAPHAWMPLRRWEALGTGLLNFIVFSLLGLYLFPLLYMVSTAFMDGRQLLDRNAPIYPAQQLTYTYQGKNRLIYTVPTDGSLRQLALVKAGRTVSEFVDPQDASAGMIQWEGNWRSLIGVYRFHATWDNFIQLFKTMRLLGMIRNTLLMILISEIGVLASSIIVAYGFTRFPLPGGNLLFYLLIATMLIPEKVTLIPTYFFFVRVLDWNGTWAGYSNIQAYVVRLEYIHRLDEAEWDFAEFLRNAKAGFQSVYGSFRALE